MLGWPWIIIAPPGSTASFAGLAPVGRIGIGNMDRQEKSLFGLRPSSKYLPFGRLEIAFALLVADRTDTERYLNVRNGSPF